MKKVKNVTFLISNIKEKYDVLTHILAQKSDAKKTFCERFPNKMEFICGRFPCFCHFFGSFYLRIEFSSTSVKTVFKVKCEQIDD